VAGQDEQVPRKERPSRPSSARRVVDVEQTRLTSDAEEDDGEDSGIEEIPPLEVGSIIVTEKPDAISTDDGR